MTVVTRINGTYQQHILVAVSSKTGFSMVSTVFGSANSVEMVINGVKQCREVFVMAWDGGWMNKSCGGGIDWPTHMRGVMYNKI
jgi:hypothetical protein